MLYSGAATHEGNADLNEDDAVAGIFANVYQPVERLLYSSNAQADLKENAGKECIRQVGVQILASDHGVGKSTKSNLSSSETDSIRHLILMKNLQLLRSYKVRPCILAFSKSEADPDESMRMQQLSRMKTSIFAKAVTGEIQYSSNKMTNPPNPFNKGCHERISHYTSSLYDIPMKNATLILMENAVVLLKWSADNFYYMVVAEKLEKESEMTSKWNYSVDGCEAETILAACCTGLKNTFGNDVKIIDVISEIPYVGKPHQSESNPGASSTCSPVVGEVTPCGHM